MAESKWQKFLREKNEGKDSVLDLSPKPPKQTKPKQRWKLPDGTWQKRTEPTPESVARVHEVITRGMGKVAPSDTPEGK